jgi:serine protease Do
MKPMKKVAGVVALAAVGTAGVLFGNGLVSDVQFARAEAQVQTSRQQLQQAEDLSTAFREVSKVVSPSVVKIEVRKTIKGVSHVLPFPDDQLKRFFPDRDGDGEPDLPPGFGDQGGEMEQIGTGSGVVMEVDGSTGYIVTNNHVAGGAEEMTITLADGRVIKNGKVLGTDPKSDLAVIKIQEDHLIPAKWGDSDKLQQGDWIVAFGAPFGYVGSMTHGIVSALHRQTDVDGGPGILGRYGYENFIQVDAPINPGNSGGPLTNLRGEVVGINTAIASRSGGFQGIGFAIPSDQAKFIYNQLKTKGKVTRGWLGVAIASVDDPHVEPMVQKSFGYKSDNGVLVQQVMPNTPASGKLQKGDIITKLDGNTVKDSQQLRDKVALIAPNTDVKMTVFRDGKEQEVTIKLGEQPEDMASIGKPGESGQGEAATAGQGKLGITLGDVNDQLAQRYGLEQGVQGAIVRQVDPKSPAAEAGIRPGDVITDVGGKKVTDANSAQQALSKADLAKGIRLYVVSKDGSRFAWIQSDNGNG